MTQIIMDCLAPMEARFTVMEKLFRATTPEGPAVAQSELVVVRSDVVVPASHQQTGEAWLRLIERYLKFG